MITLEYIFINHYPTILPETKDIIKNLAKDYTLSIGSNSNFVPGKVMHWFLQKEFGNVFEFGVYSDQIEYAKPSFYFFDEINRRSGSVERKEILHVGDNLICDVRGPINYGMESLYIKNPYQLNLIYQRLERADG